MCKNLISKLSSDEWFWNFFSLPEKKFYQSVLLTAGDVNSTEIMHLK